MRRGGRKQKRIYKVNINPLKIKVMLVITGKVLALTDKVEGQNERGDWARRSVIVEYGDEYQEKYASPLEMRSVSQLLRA